MGGDTDAPLRASAPGTERVDVDSPDDLISLKRQITDLKRRLADSEVQLDLERGRNVMARSELSEMGRKVAELQSQLERSRAGSRPLSSQRTPRPPSWTPAGSARQPTRPTSPLTGVVPVMPCLRSGIHTTFCCRTSKFAPVPETCATPSHRAR